jgi:hypothetical protein
MRRKVCSGCKVEKDLSLFPNDKRVKSGIKAQCKACVSVINKKNREIRGWTEKDRDVRLQRAFGLKPGQYAEMLEEQDYKCAVCGATEQENKKRLAVDHCHKTGKIRKLLCHKCNCALGMVDDNKDTLSSLISYLMENE